jgi:hypothetical protein
MKILIDDPIPTRNVTVKRICAYCGAKFWSERHKARYCCDAHKQAAYRERRRRNTKRA